MRRILEMSILLLSIALLVPLIVARNVPRAPAVAPPSEASSPIEAGFDTHVTDSEITFSVLSGDLTATVTMAQYLPGTLAGEMPASFEPEALKAQAVAARTYILHCAERTNPKHPSASVCDDSHCCKAYLDEQALRERWGDNFDDYYARICLAVSETDGERLLYAGSPIQAVFHSSSAVRTEASANIWLPLPYLVSVESIESEDNVPNYISYLELSPEELRNTLDIFFPEADLSSDPAAWLGETQLLTSGRVACIRIGDAQIPGSDLRELFSLRSTSFTLEYTENGSFLFTVTGYGHGVGMSQYGANAMAKSGAGYREILSHYYPGTELTSE